MSKYLWVNLIDITAQATRVGSMGSVLDFVARPELGDKRLPGAVHKPKGRVDEQYILVECQDVARPQIIADALALIGKQKIGRKIRTRITTRPPTSAWMWR